MRVLFVCLGKICRSPAAEGVLRASHPGWTIDSAGTGGWHIGDPPYGPMQQAARTRGYDLSDQRARRITGNDFQTFDRVFALDRSVLADLHRMPGGEMAELLAAAAGMGRVDVPDPYYTRDFDASLDMIEDALARLF